MTIYAGETVVFKTSVKDIDDAQTWLNDTDVTSTEIVILDSSEVEVLASDILTWDVTDEEWRYVWDTPATADTFTAKIRLVGTDFDTWEFQKVKTKALPPGF